jgi:hypothetical protein
MSEGEGFFWVVVVMTLYFLPAIVARLVHNRQTAAIFALNSLLGWTLIGWVVALVWAFIVPSEKDHQHE